MYLNKKTFFWVLFGGVLMYFLSYFNQFLQLPYRYKNFCCADDRLLNVFLIFLPVFFFNLLFLRASTTFFHIWAKFTLSYLSLFLIMYFLSPVANDGFFWLQRESVSLLFSLVYSLLSIVLITYKTLRKVE